MGGVWSKQSKRQTSAHAAPAAKEGASNVVEPKPVQKSCPSPSKESSVASKALQFTTQLTVHAAATLVDMATQRHLRHLRSLYEKSWIRPDVAEVHKTTVACIYEGTFGAAAKLLIEKYKGREVWRALAHVFDDAGEDRAALSKLLAKADQFGCNILHVVTTTNRADIPESFKPRDLWGELLDCLQLGHDTLDYMNVPSHREGLPLSSSVSWDPNKDDRAFSLVDRMSPEQLLEPYKMSDTTSTGLHLAVVFKSYQPEHMERLLAHVPDDYIAYGKDGRGRTLLMTAALRGSASWMEHLLERVPKEALYAEDSGGCTVLHFMCFLPEEVQKRIVALLSDRPDMFGAVGKSYCHTIRCTGPPLMFSMRRCASSGIISTLLELTPTSALFEAECGTGEFGRFRCTLLHLAAYGANLAFFSAILSRFEEQYRSALFVQNGAGLTPFHGIFAGTGRDNGGEILGYSYRLNGAVVKAKAQVFIDLLTDEELLTKARGKTVLDTAVYLVTQVYSGTDLPLLWDVLDDLLDRTPPAHWGASMLGDLCKITRAKELRGPRQISFARRLLTEGPPSLFTPLSSTSIYIDAMRNHPNAELAKVLLEASPPVALENPGSRIGMLLGMLASEAVRRADLRGMLELLLPYVPETLLTTCSDSMRGSLPIVAAISSGNVEAIAALLSAAPGVLDMPCKWGREESTPREIGLAHADERVRAMFQPTVKSAVDM